jgi:hypothetical protein
MAKTNFQYEKRQRELEKKKKAEEKARRKLEAKTHPQHGDEPGEPAEEVQAEGQETQDTA